MTLFEWISNYYKRIYLTADINRISLHGPALIAIDYVSLSTLKRKKVPQKVLLVIEGFSMTLSCSCQGMPRASPSCLSWISEMTVHTLKNMIAGVCCVCQVVRWLSHIPRIALLPFVWLCLYWRPDIESCFQFYSFPQFSHRLSTNQRGSELWCHT